MIRCINYLSERLIYKNMGNYVTKVEKVHKKMCSNDYFLDLVI